MRFRHKVVNTARNAWAFIIYQHSRAPSMLSPLPVSPPQLHSVSPHSTYSTHLHLVYLHPISFPLPLLPHLPTPSPFSPHPIPYLLSSLSSPHLIPYPLSSLSSPHLIPYPPSSLSSPFPLSHLSHEGSRKTVLTTRCDKRSEQEAAFLTRLRGWLVVYHVLLCVSTRLPKYAFY